MKNFLKEIYYKFSPTRRGIIQIEKVQNELICRSEQIYRKIDHLKAETEFLSTTISNNVKMINERMVTLENNIKPIPNRFSDHYEIWRIRRITAIVDYYGENWFRGKKVLELGCGYGDIGHVFITLGAEVIFTEGRTDNYDIVRKRFPNNRVYQMNCENEWPFPEEEYFDLIIHMGLLYHLDNFEFSLKKCIEHTDNLILETEVCDSSDPSLILKPDENASGYDQAMFGKGSRPSGLYIENYLKEQDWSYERISDSRCNALFHSYDWKVANTNTWRDGLRRFWFCKRQ